MENCIAFSFLLCYGISRLSYDCAVCPHLACCCDIVGRLLSLPVRSLTRALSSMPCFNHSLHRFLCAHRYNHLKPVEDELRAALDSVIEQHKDESLMQLEDVLSASITKVLTSPHTDLPYLATQRTCPLLENQFEDV